MKDRAAICLRVSKGDRYTENQRPEVERVIQTRSLKLVAEYDEKGSAAKAAVLPPKASGNCGATPMRSGYRCWSSIACHDRPRSSTAWSGCSRTTRFLSGACVLSSGALVGGS